MPSAHVELVMPSSHIVNRNAAEYSAPRIVAYEISPSATSPDVIGVASAAS